MNISVLTGYMDDADECSVPLGFVREFKRRGYQVKIYNTINHAASGISQLDPRAWTDEGLRQLLKEARDGTFIPDIVFHCDFGLFTSPLLDRRQFPQAKWICEAGDDPQCFQYNLRKMYDDTHNRFQKFDLVHSPDIRTTELYCKHGINAVWGPHFADHYLAESVEQQPIYDAVTTRHINEEFFTAVKLKLGDRFQARTDFLIGKDHVRHLKKGKIVIQNSKYKEITRRMFEGMICNRLVIVDRPDMATCIDQMFTENQDIVYFDNIKDCVDKINYYSNNDQERLRIAQNGFNKVMKSHTVSKRVDKMIQLLQIS